MVDVIVRDAGGGKTTDLVIDLLKESGDALVVAPTERHVDHIVSLLCSYDHKLMSDRGTEMVVFSRGHKRIFFRTPRNIGGRGHHIPIFIDNAHEMDDDVIDGLLGTGDVRLITARPGPTLMELERGWAIEAEQRKIMEQAQSREDRDRGEISLMQSYINGGGSTEGVDPEALGRALRLAEAAGVHPIQNAREECGGA